VAWIQDGEGKLAVSVSKKISKKAVDRNKIKRWIWTWAQKDRNKWEKVNVAIIVRGKMEEIKKGEMERCWEGIWEK